MGEDEIKEEDLSKVFILVAEASNRLALGERASEYARALKQDGCDRVEDLALFDRPFYDKAGLRYADVTQWLEVLKQASAAVSEERPEESDEPALSDSSVCLCTPVPDSRHVKGEYTRGDVLEVYGGGWVGWC